MPDMTPCTLWYRDGKVGNFEFNHLELGHSGEAKPTPRFPEQAGWSRSQWLREHAHLTHDLPARIVTTIKETP